MSLSDKWKSFTSTPQAQKTGTAFKKLETKVWRVLEPVGKGANKLAGRVGAESFWPVDYQDGEIEKAARILRTFTLDAVETDEEVAAANASPKNSPKLGGNTELQQDQLQPPPPTPQRTPSKDKYASRKTQKVIKKIPPKVLQDAAGIAIMTCFRTGLWFSGSGGSGLVMAKLPDGTWGPPSGILIHTIGVGFLIGLDIYDVVLVIRKPEAMKAFTNPKISLGAELSVAAGPVGNGAMLDSGIDAKPCWSYTKSKGAYAGVQLDGTIILKRDDANTRFYGHPVSVADIFAGKAIPQKEPLKPLLATLYAAEGRSDMVDISQIPQGQAPGEIGISPEEAKELEHIDNQGEQDQEAAEATTSKPPARFVAPSFGEKKASGSPPQTATSTQPGEVPTTSDLIGTSHNNEVAPPTISSSVSKDQASGAPPTYTEKE